MHSAGYEDPTQWCRRCQALVVSNHAYFTINMGLKYFSLGGFQKGYSQPDRRNTPGTPEYSQRPLRWCITRPLFSFESPQKIPLHPKTTLVMHL